ncbi:MAG: hypothetical protein JW702_01455, partial [Clostridiales bacterium]|nr:hypothetical protein [Clostridiales bacterium]
MKNKKDLSTKITSVLITLFLLCGSLILISVPVAAATNVTVSVDLDDVVLNNDLSLGFTLHSSTDEIEKFMTRETQQNLVKNADFKIVRLFDRHLGPNGYDIGGPCIYWNENTQTGTFDWTETDKIIREVYSVGCEPLICLSAWKDTRITVPNGMAIDPSTSLPYPESYAAFAAAWVQHFKSIGLPVRYYEIFNEIQHYIGWNPTVADQQRIANFVELFNAAYTKMHQTDSRVMVSTDCSLEKHFFSFFINNGVGIDYLDFHKYDAWKYPQFTDAEMFTRAETVYFNTDYVCYSVSDAQQMWYNKHGKMLQVILSETNFNAVAIGNNGDIGSDPRIQQMAGAVRTALLARMCVLEGIDFMAYHCFTSSYSYESQYPTGGGGFGMINRDDNEPWYPYYVLKMIGENLDSDDNILQSSVTDSVNFRTLAWENNGKLNVLIINKSHQDFNVYFQGIEGTATYQKVDENIYWTNPRVQTGQLGSYLTLDGYAVALIQCEYPQQTTHSILGSASSGGSISPSGSVSVIEGEDQLFSIIPASGYKISSVLVDGVSLGAVSTYKFTNVMTDHTIEARFSLISTSHTIIASAGDGGSVYPSGTITVNDGDSQNIAITPESGFFVSNVLVDGVSVGAVSSYRFTNVVSDHTISAS